MTPGCTTAIRTLPSTSGRGDHTQAAEVAAAVATSPATAGTRTSRTDTSTATATFTATTRKLSSHTPPTEASRNAGSTCHWVEPSSPQGPPNPCQERTSSTISQPEGSTSSAAAPRRGEGTPPRKRRTSQPHGAHSTPSRPAMTTMNTLRLGTSQLCTASMNPRPPNQPS